jgi:hypothetical protein
MHSDLYLYLHLYLCEYVCGRVTALGRSLRHSLGIRYSTEVQYTECILVEPTPQGFQIPPQGR